MSAKFQQLPDSSSLNRKQELDLTRSIKRGDEEARHLLVSTHRRLVLSIAEQYRHCGLDWVDVVQEGYVGLLLAIDRFDWRKGYRFGTYAPKVIRGAILKAIRDQSLVHYPTGLRDLTKQFQIARQQLTQEFGQEPSTDQIAAFMEITTRRARSLQSIEPVILLNSIVEIVDFISPYENLSLYKQIQETLERLVATLSPLQRQVLVLRFGLSGNQMHSPGQIARKLAPPIRSQQAIYNTQRKALARLRCKFEPELRKLWAGFTLIEHLPTDIISAASA